MNKVDRKVAEECVRKLKAMGYTIGDNGEGLIAAIIAANNPEPKPAHTQDAAKALE